MLKKIFMGICCFMLALTSSGCEKTVLTPTYEQTTGDYVLNISVSATSFKKGEDIEVTMVFENNSGQEQLIYRGDPFVKIYFLGNDNSNFHTDGGGPDTLAQGIITTTQNTGNYLKRGIYELVAIADFGIREGEGWFPMAAQMLVYSNTIFITVK